MLMCWLSSLFFVMSQVFVQIQQQNKNNIQNHGSWISQVNVEAGCEDNISFRFHFLFICKVARRMICWANCRMLGESWILGFLVFVSVFEITLGFEFFFLIWGDFVFGLVVVVVVVSPERTTGRMKKIALFFFERSSSKISE
jgi:hypothetical protein